MQQTEATPAVAVEERRCQLCQQPIHDSGDHDPDDHHIHPYVTLHHPQWGTDIRIDVDLAGLMQALWARGIDTLSSCQDNVPESYCWIDFLSAVDAEDFLTLVAGQYRQDGAGMHNRILKEHDQWGDWLYAAHPNNLGLEFTEDSRVRTGPNDFAISVSVRFPRRDLPRVLKRILTTPLIPGPSRVEA